MGTYNVREVGQEWAPLEAADLDTACLTAERMARKSVARGDYGEPDEIDSVDFWVDGPDGKRHVTVNF